MLDATEMPHENADLARIEIDFPWLAPDSAASCPVSSQQVLEYLSMEVPGGERLRWEDLKFLRTARVAAVRYWIWSFNEPADSSPAYVTVSVDDQGSTVVGYESDYYGLTPEQYLLGDYHNVF